MNIVIINWMRSDFLRFRKFIVALILIFAMAFSFAGGSFGVAIAANFEGYTSEDINDNGEYSDTNIVQPEDGDSRADIDALPFIPNDADDTDYYDNYLYLSEDEIVALSLDLVDQFVARLYIYVLNRGFDLDGLDYWANHLRAGTRTGVEVAHGFFFSDELLERNLSDLEYVNILYRALLGREADSWGRAYWVGKLTDMWSREDVFADFVNSQEFYQLCRDAGIIRGTFVPPAGGLIPVFIMRMFRTALQREPDEHGFNYWTDNLRRGRSTGALTAYRFIFSVEMIDRDLTDAQFIEILYNTLLGRDSDAGGRTYWLNRLQGGVSRFEVFSRFVMSTEFDQICRAHGIIRGTPPTSSPHAPLPLSGRIVVLDPGHGTVGSPGWGDYNEAVAMLDLALRLRPLLEAQGATVHLTRSGAANIPLPDRAAMINIWALEMVRATRTSPAEITEINRLIGLMRSIIGDPARAGQLMNVNPFNPNRTIHPELRRVFEFTSDPVIRNNFIMISLHSNATAGGNTTVRGAEMHLINPNLHANTRTYFTGYSFVNESRALGDILLNHIATAGIPRRTHGLIASNFAIIREVNVPSVLAENGFHTNPQDRALLSNPTWRQTLATHYVDAILQYFASR